jgi:hypothetical protein
MTEPPRRPRHLLDPADLHGSHTRSQGTTKSLTRVQRIVMAALAATTIEHLAFGLALAAVVVDPTRPFAQPGLCVLASLAGALGVVTARAILGKSWLSPWLLLALVPGLTGAALIWVF